MTAETGQNLRILILEDNPLISLDLEDELAERGFNPVCAETVPKARRVLDAGEVSFAILDMHLKTDTSFAFADRLRNQGIPFAFLSGNDTSLLPESLRTCVVHTKPVAIEDLVRDISSRANALDV